MNLIKSIITLLKVGIFISTASFAVNATAAATTQRPMQHYVFKYNFQKGQDLVVKMINETQQYVRFEVAVDVLNMAHHSIREMSEEASYLVTLPVEDSTKHSLTMLSTE